MSFSTITRRQAILKLLDKKSRLTVRDVLSGQGHLIKTYGGAIRSENGTDFISPQQVALYSAQHHRITCNAVAPGMIRTDMTRWHWDQPGPAEEIKRRVPVGRIGTPHDIGNAVVFLCSPQSSYISGITIRVDGGHQAVCC